ncbi:hypothetical protein [Streptomyces sp. L2]|uniref:hypothetical protein n=1 Tax=Streptomyces sp. L2 TaxID=2162665 RepID=UPI001F5089A3|nr:hypothetical protein [Streptomyces sp. L2]
MFVADRVIPVLYFPSHGQDRRNLLSAAARLVLLLGNMTADSGRSGRAQQFHRVAARFAADAGDSVTLAIALRTMAAHAYELGHRSPAVLRLSEQAVFHANDAPPAVQAYAQAHYAVLLAHYDRQAAMEALTRAEHLHGRADAPIGPFTAYPISAMYYQRAQALSVLGDHSASVNALTTSLRLRAATEYRAACLTRACLAEAYLRSGHLEKALTHWQAFLTAYPTLSSTRATRYLSTMSMRLRPYQRHRIARQLLDQAYLLR